MPNTFQVPPPGGQLVDNNGVVTRNWWWFFFNLFNASGAGGLITKLGTVTVGVWHATRIGVGFGGTGADLTGTGGAHQVLRQATVGGSITVSQLAAGDISGLAAIASSGSASDLTAGTVPPARLPVPTATTLGGVESLAAVSHNFLTSISTAGVPVAAQPTSADVLGTATNDNAASGYIGEYISANVPIGSAVSLSTGVAKIVTSISLTAGDWDVSGTVGFSEGATTTCTQQIAAINTADNTLPTSPGAGAYAQQGGTGVAGTGAVMPTGTTRLLLTATTTVYLVAQAAFATSTNAAYGFIAARRARQESFTVD